MVCYPLYRCVFRTAVGAGMHFGGGGGFADISTCVFFLFFMPRKIYYTQDKMWYLGLIPSAADLADL